MSDPIIDFSSLDAELADLRSAPHWYLGFSGGVDSTALLHLLTRWRRANPDAPALTAIHINHGMQSAADEWQVHCEWVCRMLRVPLISRRVTVSIMSQYYPSHLASEIPQLRRKISVVEYLAVLRLVDELGLENGWIQEMDAADNYLPDFDRGGHPFSTEAPGI